MKRIRRRGVKPKKKKIKVSSAKAKGRRLQQWVAQKISDITGIPCGKDELIESREMGQSGVDVKLYGEAKELFPFSIECKYQESWSIPAWIKQAKENLMPNTNWLLFVRRNNYKEIVIMDAKEWFKMYERLLDLKQGDGSE